MKGIGRNIQFNQIFKRQYCTKEIMKSDNNQSDNEWNDDNNNKVI